MPCLHLIKLYSLIIAILFGINYAGTVVTSKDAVYRLAKYCNFYNNNSHACQPFITACIPGRTHQSVAGEQAWAWSGGRDTQSANIIMGCLLV